MDKTSVKCPCEHPHPTQMYIYSSDEFFLHACICGMILCLHDCPAVTPHWILILLNQQRIFPSLIISLMQKKSFLKALKLCPFVLPHSASDQNNESSAFTKAAAAQSHFHKTSCTIGFSHDWWLYVGSTRALPALTTSCYCSKTYLRFF